METHDNISTNSISAIIDRVFQRRAGIHFQQKSGLDNDIVFMDRALSLARFGLGQVSPNPLVGCVLVSDNRIIGEGWHMHFGQNHAEAAALTDAVSKGFGDRIAGSTVYVTLEPCAHYGKTPPCANLLVSKKVGRVVLAQADPDPRVAGKGISMLKEAGIQVQAGIQATDAAELNRRFLKGIERGRPYVILKWAQSADGYLSLSGKRVKISGSAADQVVHKWRAEEDAILVGKNTVLTDNPRLNVRNWAGRNPVRIILDRHLQTAAVGVSVFDRSQPTVFVNYLKDETGIDFPNELYTEHQDYPVIYLKVEPGEKELADLLSRLYLGGIGSVLVEGGASVLSGFLSAGLWDEIRLIEGSTKLGSGVKGPLPAGTLIGSERLGTDTVRYYRAVVG